MPAGASWNNLEPSRYQLIPTVSSWYQLVPDGTSWYQLAPADLTLTCSPHGGRTPHVRPIHLTCSGRFDRPPI